MNALSAGLERRLLQITIALAGFVPVGAGMLGGLLGSTMTGDPVASLSIDSHIRYLSGLLLGIGLAFWECIPQIEHRGPRIRLMTAIVFLGGLMRLIGLIAMGVPGGGMIFGLCMELVVTPLVCLWQWRVARRYKAGG
ncbi:DUF4345 domain-containing protein [Beijerinckia sp. L45]|uniref:DUF4345 domain-containing protein n=1 Tax=Beijerinckia sp. L45 TaxID=1641855 RepID=UPI001FEFC22D|nr:DUF4345 domain-containing protein [Beijerinckia sp. L45]